MRVSTTLNDQPCLMSKVCSWVRLFSAALSEYMSVPLKTKPLIGLENSVGQKGAVSTGRRRVSATACVDGSVALTDFVNPALLVELFDGALHITAGQLFDDSLQRRILLPHDVVEPGGADTGLLELSVRSAGVYGFMLAHVAHEQHAVLGAETAETAEKRVHLFGAGQA